MRSFIRGINFMVVVAFVGIPALEAASITVPGNGKLNNPPAAWNLVFPGLEQDQLRCATEKTSSFAKRISLNGSTNLEEVSGGLPGPPTGRRKQTEESIPDKHLRSPYDPEDDLARFVSQMMAPGCGQACSDFAVTYSCLTSPFPSDPEDELAEFVSLMRAADCVSIGPMQFYSAVTYSYIPFTFRAPFRFKGRIGRIH
jgi:hypothetical protein